MATYETKPLFDRTNKVLELWGFGEFDGESAGELSNRKNCEVERPQICSYK